MYKIEQIDHTADIGYHITSDSIEDLFKGAVLALYNTVIDLKHVKSGQQYQFSLNNQDMDDLLYSCLKMCLDHYYQTGFIAKNILFLEIRNKAELKIMLEGSQLTDSLKDKLKYDIKSITYHQLSIKKVKQGFASNIILDV